MQERTAASAEGEVFPDTSPTVTIFLCAGAQFAVSRSEAFSGVLTAVTRGGHPGLATIETCTGASCEMSEYAPVTGSTPRGKGATSVTAGTAAFSCRVDKDSRYRILLAEL